MADCLQGELVLPIRLYRRYFFPKLYELTLYPKGFDENIFKTFYNMLKIVSFCNSLYSIKTFEHLKYSAPKSNVCMCVRGFPTSTFNSDTSWVAYSSILFWQYPPWDSIRFNCLTSQSYMTAPHTPQTSNSNRSPSY